ncbi:MAG: T9SS type A sorting domain-containing protein [Flavobacteriales bacterium]
MIRIQILAVFLSLASLHALGQEFIRELDIPVFEEDVELRNPWAGGLNYAQYSKIDLDLDGVEDLFVYDKTSGIVSTFINQSSVPGTLNYKLAPEYVSLFPLEELSAWVLLRDYNCDGLKDVFTNGGGGFKLFEQSLNGEEIAFTEVYEFLVPSVYEFETPEVYPAFNTSIDLPHIGDIDGDGDVDILTASDGSLNVFFYINNASDDGRCDTLALELANTCYGFFSEASESNDLSLGITCENNVLNPRSFENRPLLENSRDGLHAGGTLLSLETNGDGLQELVVGDITNDSLHMLLNGTSTQGPDSMVLQFDDFPANLSDTEAIGLHEFPGLYHEDYNNDGVKDLAVSSFSRFNSADDFGSWLYLNEGSDDFPDFQLEKKDWLQDEMLEHGTGAIPVIVDYNSDGLGDLVLGHEKNIVNATTFNSSLRLYENIGTSTDPIFELITEDWGGLSVLGLENLCPAFGDLDGDGDTDMILGERQGVIHFFENTADSGDPMDISTANVVLNYTDVNGEEIDPGQDSFPQLIDLDEDGLLDLILGELNGKINFYRNVGTATDFQFELENGELGGVYVESIFGIQGNSTPHFYKNNTEDWKLLSGNELGFIQRWGGINDNLDGVFQLEDLELQEINDGRHSSPHLFDINGDGYLDLFIGNERGGITLYFGQLFDSVEETLVEQPIVKMFPNPTLGNVQLEFQREIMPDGVSVYNLLGEKLLTQPVNYAKLNLDVSVLPHGVYILMGEYGNLNTSLGRIIKE